MRWRAAVLLGLAPAGAQAGHLIAYQARFGAAAVQVQSAGSHAYFPAAVKTALGLAALALLGSLLLIAVARLVALGVRVRRVDAPSYVSLLALLFTAQLMWFVAQEVVEAVVVGVPADSAATLMLWGTVGQLPAAALLAAALRWMWTRVEHAVAQLLEVRPTLRLIAPPAPVAFVFVGSEDRTHRVEPRSPYPRRGPPHSS
jgi:hypothetical protein